MSRKHKVIDSDGNEIRVEEHVSHEDVEAARRANEPWQWVAGVKTVTTDGRGGVMLTVEFVPSNRPDVLLKNNRCPQCSRPWPHTGVCHMCEMSDMKQRAAQRVKNLTAAIDCTDRQLKQLPEGEFNGP